jgi:hypothetical protein
MSAPMHLDERRWDALLHDRAAPEERDALLRHLEEPCETCEGFLAEIGARGALDRLDGPADEALLAVGRAKAEAAFDELGFARVTQAIARRRTRRRLWAALPIGAALAASIAIAVLLRPSTPGPEDPSRLKGPPPAVASKVHLVVADQDRVLKDRDRVAIGATLVFRIELEQPGCVMLNVIKRGAAEALLDAPLCSNAAGARAIAKDGQALGYKVDQGDAPALVFSLSRVGGAAGEGDRIALEVSE